MGVYQRTVELSIEVYLTSNTSRPFPASAPQSVSMLFYVDGFVATEGWKIGFNKSKLIEKLALLVCNHNDFQVRFYPLTNH